MKKSLPALILALCLLFSFAAAEENAADGYFASCSTILDHFRAAEKALADGVLPETVYTAMSAAADRNELAPYFQYALENAAAADTEMTQRLSTLAADSRRSLGKAPTFSARSSRADIGFDAYEKYVGSTAFREMIADPSAQACLSPMIWDESDFRSVYGVDFAKFKPSRPRPGYVCIVIRSDTQCWPETGWTGGDLSVLKDFIQDLATDMADAIPADGETAGPVVTGNPDLASSFWEFDLKFVFYSYYGTDSSVRGFHTDGSLAVIDASHKTVAKLSARSVLPDRIGRWSNGIAYADPPRLQDQAGYDAAVAKVRKEIQLEESTANSGRVMTAGNAAGVLNGLLMELARDSRDAWLVAICESGVRDVTLDAESVTFSLRGYDPKTKELGAYSKADDPVVWLKTALDNASDYHLTLTLPTESGKLTAKALTTLKSAIGKAANTAKQGYSSKDMAAALKDWLFPVPVEGKTADAASLSEPTESFTRFSSILDPESAESGNRFRKAIACWANKSVKLAFTGGPHAVTVSLTGADPVTLVSDSANALLDELAFRPAGSRAEVTEEALLAKMAEAAADAHAKGKVKTELTIDTDEIAAGRMPAAYREYLAAFGTEDALKRLISTAGQLPDRAATAFPKTAVLYGGKSGTKVIFKISAKSSATYVQMRQENGNRLVSSAFIHPGKSVNMRVPSGKYRIVWCSGPYWYGEQELFGDLGSYQKSDTVEILGKQYYHTFTLETSEDGDIHIYAGSPDDFR